MNTEYLNIQPLNFHFKIRLNTFSLELSSSYFPLIIKNEMGGFCFPLIRKKYCFGHKECQTHSNNTSADFAAGLCPCSCGPQPPFQSLSPVLPPVGRGSSEVTGDHLSRPSHADRRMQPHRRAQEWATSTTAI